MTPEEQKKIYDNQAGTLAGRTLSGNPLDTSSVYSNPVKIPDTISSSLITTPTLPPPPPVPSSGENYGAHIAGAIPQPTDTTYADKSKANVSSIESLVAQLQGKEAYTQTQDELAGVNAINARQRSLTGKLTALNNSAQAIPLLLQQQSEGRGITTGGLAPLQAGELRKNAIEALTLKSEYDMNAGDLITAKENAQKAVDLKYKDIETNIDHNTALLKLYEPFFTAEEKKKADAQVLINEQNKTELADKKKIQNDVINAAQASGDSVLASKAISLDPNSSTFITDLAAIQGQIKAKVTGQSDFEQAFLRDNGRLPTVNELKAYRAGDPNSALNQLRLLQVAQGSQASNGQIVNAKTQTPVKTTQVETDFISKSSQISDYYVPTLETMLKGIETGAVVGLQKYTAKTPIAQYLRNEDLSMFNALASYFGQQIVYMNSGKAINPEEMKILQQSLPDAQLTTSENLKRIAQFDKISKQATDKYLKLKGWSIYNNGTSGGTSGGGGGTPPVAKDGDIKLYNGVNYKVVNGVWTPQK